MATYSVDIRYAYIQLGIQAGATFDKIHVVWTNAAAYQFVTRARKQHVQHFVDYFIARSQLGIVEESFEEIRKSYYRQAKILHPDKNKNDKTAEDQLKVLNAAYEIVDKMHREAKTYFQKSEEERRQIENEIRETGARESAVTKKRAPEPDEERRNTARESTPPPQPDRRVSTKFMAASIPRYIRNARLFYLGSNVVIGSRLVKASKGQGLVYDVIMLPEREFMRAKTHLGIEGGSGSPELSMSLLTPAYIPMDTKQVFIPLSESNPYLAARDYFIKEFRLDAV